MKREPQPTGELPGRVVLPQRSSVRWPDDSRLAVLLSFDCYGGEAFSSIPFVATTFDYGLRRGIWHILESFDKLDVKATFHFPGVTAAAHPRVVEAVAQAGHDVAALGYRYEPHWDFTEAEERESIQRTIAAIEGVIKERPTGWRTPQSRPSLYTLPLLCQLGFVWDSSLRNDELPYRMEFDEGALIEIPFGGANDYQNYYGFPPPSPPAHKVFSVWHEELNVLYEESERQRTMLILCLHPTFHGRPAELDELERFITRIKNLDGAWFARCSDVAHWWVRNQNWT